MLTNGIFSFQSFICLGGSCDTQGQEGDSSEVRYNVETV